MGRGRSAKSRTAVLIDQHPLWLDALERLVARAGVAVVARSTGSAEALEQLPELKPNLLITGLTMPPGELDGIALIGYAREWVPGLKVLVLSDRDDAESVGSAFAAGAHAYVVKTAPLDDILAAVRQASRPSIFLATPGGAGGTADGATPESETAPTVTRHELEILHLLDEGHSNAELARMLWETEQTVELRLSSIYAKLGVEDRAEAIHWGRKHALQRPFAGRAA
jgi:DNA-binding NarL/FixJ family response regulator